VKIASIAAVKARFSEYLKESEKGAVVVTRNGHPVAVILGTRDEDEIERLILGHSKRLREILEAARQRIREGKGIPADEFWRQVEAENAQAAESDRAPAQEEERSKPAKPDRPGPKRPGARKAAAKRS
jgi:prevent-host-death family protein